MNSLGLNILLFDFQIHVKHIQPDLIIPVGKMLLREQQRNMQINVSSKQFINYESLSNSFDMINIENKVKAKYSTKIIIHQATLIFTNKNQKKARSSSDRNFIPMALRVWIA